jgi:tetratricopeptide (TPR) repeat protein
MTDRLTHQEMKRDPLVENVERSYEFLARHLKTILMAFGALVAVSLVVVLVWVWRAQQAEKASESLAHAQMVSQAPAGVAEPEPDNLDNPSYADEAARREAARAAFQTVVDEHGGTAAAQVARLYLGQMAAQDGDTARARELWHEVTGAPGALGGQAWRNLLALDRSEGRIDEALEELQEMRGDSDGPLPGDVVLFEMAQTYEAADREDEAVAAYQDLLEEYPDSVFSDIAQQRAGAVESTVFPPGFSLGS